MTGSGPVFCVTHKVLTITRLISLANKGIFTKNFAEAEAKVYRVLTSRLLAMALMIALLAKPCLGLLANLPSSEPAPSLNRIAISTGLSQKDAPCNRVCLSARIEEVHASVMPAKAKLTGTPSFTLAGSGPAFHLHLSGKPPSSLQVRNVRSRLAMLSRLLL